MAQNLIWESVSWRCGQDEYRFEIERGGLFAGLKDPTGRVTMLPMVVWEGLVDALKANRSTRTRGEHRQQFPARSRARWYEGEIAEVADAFRRGQSVPEIAHAHNRSTHSIEHQLDRLGLISKASIYGPGPADEARTELALRESTAPVMTLMSAQPEAKPGWRQLPPSGSNRAFEGRATFGLPEPPPLPNDSWEVRE